MLAHKKELDVLNSSRPVKEFEKVDVVPLQENRLSDQTKSILDNKHPLSLIVSGDYVEPEEERDLASNVDFGSGQPEGRMGEE